MRHKRSREALGARGSLLLLLAAGCGAVHGHKNPIQTSAATTEMCGVARNERERVAPLVAEGKLDRATRVLAHADGVCASEAPATWALRVMLLADLRRDGEASALADRIFANASASAEARTAAERARRAVGQPMPPIRELFAEVDAHPSASPARQRALDRLAARLELDEHAEREVVAALPDDVDFPRWVDDDRLVVSGSVDRVARVVDVATRRVHALSLTEVAGGAHMSASRRFAIAEVQDGVAFVRDERMAVPHRLHDVRLMAVSPYDDRILVTEPDPGFARTIDLETGASGGRTRALDYMEPRFLADELARATAGARAVRLTRLPFGPRVLWNADTREPLIVVGTTAVEVTTHAGGTTIAVGGIDGEHFLRVGGKAQRIHRGACAHGFGIALDPEGTKVYSAIESGVFCTIDLRTGAARQTGRVTPRDPNDHGPSGVPSVRTVPDGMLMFDGGFGFATLYEAASGKELGVTGGRLTPLASGSHATEFLHAAADIAPDHLYLTATGISVPRGVLRRVDPISRHVLWTRDVVGVAPLGPYYVSSSPRGERVLVHSTFGFTVLEARQGKHVMRHPAPGVAQVAFAGARKLSVLEGDGSVLAIDLTGGSVARIEPGTDIALAALDARGQVAWLSHDGAVRFGDEQTFRPVFTIAPWNAPHEFFVSDDGTRIAAGDTVWDRVRGKAVGRFDSGPLSPDGRRAFSVGRAGVHLVDVESGAALAEVPAWNGSSKAAFSADGKRVASAMDDKVVVWNAVTGKVERTVNAAKVQRVALSADGRFMIADAALWNLETGERREVPNEWACTFSPDASLLACAFGSAVQLLRSKDLAEVLRLDLVTDAAAVVAFVHGDVDLLGDELRARSSLACKIGTQLLDFDVCEERFRAKGLARGALH
jgi:hypothetical protein